MTLIPFYFLQGFAFVVAEDEYVIRVHYRPVPFVLFWILTRSWSIHLVCDSCVGCLIPAIAAGFYVQQNVGLYLTKTEKHTVLRRPLP